MQVKQELRRGSPLAGLKVWGRSVKLRLVFDPMGPVVLKVLVLQVVELE